MTQYIAPRFMTHRTAEGQGVQIQRLTPRHYALMDFILANPTLSMGEVALSFGVTQAWLSTVYHSDLFQHVINERRNAISSDYDRTTVAKLRVIADKGLNSLVDALDDEETPLNSRQSITEMSLKALGYLGKGAAQPQVVIQNNNIQQNGPAIDLQDAIQAARARILKRQSEPLVIQHKETPDENHSDS